MTKASDNVYPRLLISEGGSTATPAAARVTIYAKSDGLLYSKDDAGAETALGGGGGDITTDPAWAAAGDLIVATGNNAASVLTKGSDGKVLTMVSGAVAWDAPASGADGYGPAGMYSPDRIPASYNAASDEFDDSALHGDWAWSSAISGTVSESAFPGHLHIAGGTDNSNTERFLRRAYVPGATSFSVVAKVSLSMEAGNYFAGVGPVLLDSGDAVIWSIRLATNGTSEGSLSHRLITTVGAGSVYGDQLNDGWYYLLIQRNASNVYKGYFSRNGLTWQYLASSTVATTVARVGITYGSDTDAVEPEAAVDFIRVFDAATKTVGST